jgi:hypothetical protein
VRTGELTPPAVGRARPRRDGALLGLLGATLLGAVLRLPTLGNQSLWLDELYTHWLAGLDFDRMLEEIPRTERTPYVFYLLEWLAVRLVGDGEAGSRALSSAAGIATIPAAYLAGAALATRRVGLAAAILVAVNPFLVWYSQEARAYALAILLGTLALWCWARCLDGAGWALVAWPLVAALAFATHYLALLVVVPQALWLLVRCHPVWRVAAGIGFVAAVVAAHVPLLLDQAEGGRSYGDTSLPERLAGALKDVVVGYSFPYELVGMTAGAALVGYGAVLALRARAPHRRAVVRAGGVGVAALGLALALVPFGHDYVTPPHLAAALVPLLVSLGAGLASRRAGGIALGALAALSVAIVVAGTADPRYGRTDWRGAARGAADGVRPRALVVTPVIRSDLLAPYFPSLVSMEQPARVRRIVVIGLATEGARTTGPVVPPPPRAVRPPRGFSLGPVVERRTYALVIYESARPQLVTPEELQPLRLAGAYARVFVQR